MQSLPTTSELGVACAAIGGLINVFVSSSVELYSYMFMYEQHLDRWKITKIMNSIH